jgi:phosphomannomutase
MLNSIFKLYDIRGKYPSQINEVVVFDIVRKLPMLFGENATVVIGHDARHSSPILYKTAIKTLQDLNYTVIATGMITTPMIMFLIRHFKADVGLMITASHNPKDQNGIKIIDGDLHIIGGRDLFGKITQFFLDGEPERTLRRKPVKERTADARKGYIQFLNKFFETGKGAKKVKVVIDMSNGASGPTVSRMKFPAGVETVFVNAKPDGNFPGHGPNPLAPQALADVQRAIKKHKADMGVVFDGDGDRAVFVDNNGRMVRPEYVWRLIAGHEKYSRSVLTELNAYLVTKMMRARALPRTRLFLSKVGRLSFTQAMKRHNADFGFENSGHYYFKEFFYSDSGILVMIKAINALRALPYSLADFVDLLPHTVRLPETDVGVRQATPMLYHTLADILGKHAKKISFFESLTMHFDDMVLNVRNSNTEDVVRVNAEGEDEKKVKALLKKTVKMVKEMGRWKG